MLTPRSSPYISWRRFDDASFVCPPRFGAAEGYGYFSEKKVARTFRFLNRGDAEHSSVIWEQCALRSLDDLRSHVESSEGELYVWTPSHAEGVPSELCPALTKPLFEKKLRAARSGAKVAGLNCILWGLLLFGLGGISRSSGLFFMMVGFGLFPFVGHLIELYARKSRPLHCARQDRENWLFIRWVQQAVPSTTWALCVGVLLLGCVQFFYTGIDDSVALAGLDTVAVSGGEAWRLVTGPLLHANYIHITFNLIALWFLGRVVERVCGGRVVLFVFSVSLVVGALFSWMFLYGRTSVGASGAVLGLIGFLVMIAYRNQGQFPRAYAQNLFFNLVSIAVFGILLVEVIDNAAHLGGTLAGAAIGLCYCRQIKGCSLIGAATPQMIKYVSPLAGAFLAAAALTTCLKLLQ